MLKDDKAYPHLKLTINEDFPRILKPARSRRTTRLLRPVPARFAGRQDRLARQPRFQLRTCSDEVYEIYRRAGRPCMEYQIKRCWALPEELCKPEQYREAVQDVKLLLDGKDKELADELEARMLKASEELQFEQAAKYRDLLKTVRALSEHQEDDGDARPRHRHFWLLREGHQLSLHLFTMREGRVVGGANSIGKTFRLKASIRPNSRNRARTVLHHRQLRAAGDSRAGRLGEPRGA